MALDGAIVTGADSTAVFFGTPTADGSGGGGGGGSGGSSITIDVTDDAYGAVGDGVTDDTTAIQLAIAAAEALSSTAGRAVLYFPPSKTYLVQDPTAVPGDVDSLDVPSAPLHFSTTARNIDILGYGATLKLGDNGVDNSVLRIFGSRIRVFGLTIDVGASAAILALKGCTAFEVNGSLDEGVQGTDCEFIDCWALNGFFSQTDPNQGQEHFLAVGSTRPRWVNCHSHDSGWTAFRAAGSDPIWIGCVAQGHRGNGFRVNVGTTYRFNGCTTNSSRNSGRSGFLVDPGSTPGWPVQRATRVFMTQCVGFSSSDGDDDGGCALVKLAAADEVHIDQCEFKVDTGLTSSINYAFRVEDNLRKVVVKNTYIKGGVIFSPDQFHGAPTAQASGWDPDGVSGYVQFTMPASHGVIEGNTIFIQDSDIPEYNRPHNVSSDGNEKRRDHLPLPTFYSITDNGAGKCLFTCAAGHNVQDADTITVTGSGTGAYNTTHTVVGAPTATTFVTNRNYVADSISNTLSFTNSVIRITTDVPYVPGSLGANIYAHQGVDELHMRHVTIENDWTDTGSDQVDILQEAHCRILNLEDVTMRFNGVRNEKLRGIGWYMPDAGLDLMRFKNVQIIGDTGNVFSGVKPLEARGTDEVQRITIINSGAGGGSFTINTNGFGTTGSITCDVSSTSTTRANIQSALRALTGLGSVSVAFTSGDFTAGAIFTVTFAGTAGNISQMSTGVDSMTGTAHSLSYSTTTPGVLSTQLVTSGRTIGLNFTIVNKGSGSTYLVSPYQETDVGTPYADRLTLFNSIADATGAYKATAVPSSIAVGWQVGDFIRNSAPGSGDSPGWHCIATTSAGSSPSFQSEAALS